MKKVFVLSGPNMDLLGVREPDTYGHETLDDVKALCQKTASALDTEIEFRQTNHEGKMIDWIHEAREKAIALVINPGAWTHTSIAIRDAITGVSLPLWEVHITNIHTREAFRNHSYLSEIAHGVICGFGIRGYQYALQEACRQ